MSFNSYKILGLLRAVFSATGSSDGSLRIGFLKDFNGRFSSFMQFKLCLSRKMHASVGEYSF